MASLTVPVNVLPLAAAKAGETANAAPRIRSSRAYPSFCVREFISFFSLCDDLVDDGAVRCHQLGPDRDRVIIKNAPAGGQVTSRCVNYCELLRRAYRVLNIHIYALVADIGGEMHGVLPVEVCGKKFVRLRPELVDVAEVVDVSRPQL